MVQKEDEERVPPKDPSAADLLTAQDIFGEVLESLGEDYAAPPESARPVASECGSPIEVHVSEPGAVEKTPMASPGDDVLPEDLATLLDAFDPQPPPEPEPEPEVQAELAEPSPPSPPPAEEAAHFQVRV